CPHERRERLRPVVVRLAQELDGKRADRLVGGGEGEPDVLEPTGQVHRRAGPVLNGEQPVEVVVARVEERGRAPGYIGPHAVTLVPGSSVGRPLRWRVCAARSIFWRSSSPDSP